MRLNNYMGDKEFEKWVSELKGLKKSGLSENRKEKMKKNLFTKMDAFSAARFSLDKVSRARIKERIMEVLDVSAQKSRFSPSRVFGDVFFGARFRAVVSVVTVFALVFGIFGVVRTDQDVVHAGTLTFLKNYEGEVFVEREGEVIDVYEGMYLFEDDVVCTLEDGQAVIEYFDSSVNRLSGNTKIVLSRLESPEKFSGSGGIEVMVLKGTVWSKVLDVYEADAFFSVGAKDVYASADRAAFNFRVGEDSLEIGVFRNSVDVRDEEDVEKLISGEKLIVSNGHDRVKEVRDVEKYESEDEWVRKNIAYDKKYLSEVENRLLAARAEAVGIDIDDVITFDRSLRENALMFFTFDDVKAKKRELELAERDFIAAQIKLRYGDLDEKELEEVNRVIADFDSKVRSFYDFAEQIAYTDKEYSKNLKSYIANKVTVNKRDLEGVMPDSPVYVVRGVVEELELLLVEDPSEVADVKLRQTVDRLVAIDDVFYEENGFWNSDLAAEYTENVVKALSLLDGMDQEKYEKFEDTKRLLVRKIRNDMQMFEEMDFVSEEDMNKLRSVVAVSVPAAVSEDRDVEDSGEDVSIAGIAFEGDLGEMEDMESVEELEEAEIVEIIDSDLVIKGPYGVSVRGDKPLGPMLE